MREEKDVKKGDFFRRYGRNHKVIGIVERYAVTRLKGCAPGIHPIKELINGKHGWEDLQSDVYLPISDRR